MRSSQIPEDDDSMIRYQLLSKGFQWYEDQGITMGPEQSLNLTAVMGDKGS